MRIHYMEYFIHVVDCGSIRAAASELFITPQGMSQALQRLEQQYGAQLLFRDGTTIRPTKIGDEVYEAFKRIISINDCLTDQLAEDYPSDSSFEDSLTIFSSAILTTTVLPSLIPFFSKRNPRIKLKILELPCKSSLYAFENPENMICLYGTTPSTVDAFEQKFPSLTERHTICRLNMHAYVSENSQLSGKEYISQEDFTGKDVVLCRNEEFFLRKILNNHDYERVLIRSNSKLLCFSAVAANTNAIGFTNKMEHLIYENKHIVTMPLLPRQDIVFGYLVSPGSKARPSLSSFCTMIENCLRQYERDFND